MTFIKVIYEYEITNVNHAFECINDAGKIYIFSNNENLSTLNWHRIEYTQLPIPNTSLVELTIKARVTAHSQNFEKNFKNIRKNFKKKFLSGIFQTNQSFVILERAVTLNKVNGAALHKIINDNAKEYEHMNV